jgi:hypothetical protein
MSQSRYFLFDISSRLQFRNYRGPVNSFFRKGIHNTSAACTPFIVFDSFQKTPEDSANSFIQRSGLMPRRRSGSRPVPVQTTRRLETFGLEQETRSPVRGGGYSRTRAPRLPVERFSVPARPDAQDTNKQVYLEFCSGELNSSFRGHPPREALVKAR